MNTALSSSDRVDFAWIKAAVGWVFDPVKWILLFGILVPSWITSPVFPYALTAGSDWFYPVVFVATVVVACTVVSRTQALSRSAGLIVCSIFLLAPLTLGSLISYDIVHALGALVFAGGLLMPIGLFGIFWIFLWGTRNLGQGGLRAFVNGSPKTALGYFALAARKGPNARRQALDQATILSTKGHPHKAAQVCALLTQNEPGNILFWRSSASFEWLAGNLEASVQASEAALKLEPENPALYFERGVRWARSRSHETTALGVNDIRRALELAPANDDYQRALASLLKEPPDVASLPSEGQLLSPGGDGRASSKPPQL